MKRIDKSERGIFEIGWSPDGRWLSYVRQENEVCIADASSGEIRVVGEGKSPGLTANVSVVLERDDEILLAGGSGTRVLVGRNSLVKGTPKRHPVLSPDGSRMMFVVANVFDKESQSKNAYAYRNFVGIAEIDDGKPRMTSNQWYGGSGAWSPDGSMFAHFEFDSTGGARVHVVDENGEVQGIVFGLYPSVSPDGRRIACKPRSGGMTTIYTSKGSWKETSIESKSVRITETDGRLSATPPLWLDNRFLLMDEAGKMWRLDSKRDRAEEIKKLPVPARRGTSAMAISPSRELLAAEIPVDDGFELVVSPLD
ncbi:MAG: hypothetical protein R6V85_08145 [Polyangia bacterium]